MGALLKPSDLFKMYVPLLCFPFLYKASLQCHGEVVIQAMKAIKTMAKSISEIDGICLALEKHRHMFHWQIPSWNKYT